MQKASVNLGADANRCISVGAVTILLTGLALLMPACVPGEGLSFQRKPKLTTTVTAGDVPITLGGPRGYCSSQRQRHESSTGAFAVFGVCPREAGAAMPKAKGLLIANVLANPELGKSENANSILAQLRSKDGRRWLSNSDDALTVDILETRVRDNVVYIHTRDARGPLIPDTTSEQWRGFLIIKGRLISVSMLNFIDSAVSTDEVFVLVREFSSKIKELNTASG